MSNRTNTQKWESIAKRLNYIEYQLNLMEWKEVDEAWNAVNTAGEKLRKLFGEKIAFEIECKAGRK